MRLDVHPRVEKLLDFSSNANIQQQAVPARPKFLKSNTSTTTKLASQIMSILFNRRRLLPGQDSVLCELTKEYQPHLPAIEKTVALGEPLTLILPAFPAKSPNRRKTLGPLPDLAEKHALENLSLLCQRIREIYPPGAKIVICSDGRVFADLVRINDDDVTAYADYLKRHALSRHGDNFDFFNLDDIFQQIPDFDIRREELLIRYGESIETLRQRCKTDKASAAMYKGITRFIFEDYCGLEDFSSCSRSAIQRKARSIAYRVIQRSNAWTRLLEVHFPDSVRLSIHPQFRISKKIGVFLVDADDCWQTPWHTVAVKQAGKIRLMKRIEAEKLGLLAFADGRPSHFEIINCDRCGP